jgi:signal transduction histidine kinase
MASAAVLLGYVPHLVRLIAVGAPAVDPALELVLLPAVGILVGTFADSARRHRGVAVARARLAALGEVALALTEQAEGPLAAIQGQTESLRYLAEKREDVATEFAAEVISGNAARIQRFFAELHGLQHGRNRGASIIDLSAFASGVVADIQSETGGTGSPSRLVLGGRQPGVRVRADVHVLAYALRALIETLLSANPTPRRIEVGVEAELGRPVLRIRAIYDGPCPHEVYSGSSISGSQRRDDQNVRRALSIHLLASEGGGVEVTRPFPDQALFRIHLAAAGRGSNVTGEKERTRHDRCRTASKVA